MRLIRVCYGKKGVPQYLREYQVEGRGPVGTIKEYKQAFPGKKFTLVDMYDGETK